MQAKAGYASGELTATSDLQDLSVNSKLFTTILLTPLILEIGIFDSAQTQPRTK